MADIVPTVGRVMLYYRGGKAAGEADPLAATVAKVWANDARVNIGYLDSFGVHRDRQDVPYYQSFADGPDGSEFVCWMPYQLGQAAKTEAVEKANKK